MAAGKTTVGRILAARLRWEFLDFDEAIVERAGRTPGEIIRQDGESAFRAVEAALTAELAGRGGVVLAPGGGWGGDPAVVASLGEGTVRVWLRISPEEAVRRADRDATDRPLLGAGPGRLERAAALLREREDRYGRADMVVDVQGREPERVADEIVRRLEAHSGGR
ncbi:MAG TPA: shikimate kinase [Longimicrobiales bacterium]|nr:shikimate kinase [Longimicrobiales bacterium]